MTIMSNELYLTVLPLIHLRDGATEQVITLTPDKKFASEFFPDEVNLYIKFFEARKDIIIGGHVKDYKLSPEKNLQGRFVIRVTQYVE